MGTSSFPARLVETLRRNLVPSSERAGTQKIRPQLFFLERILYNIFSYSIFSVAFFSGGPVRMQSIRSSLRRHWARDVQTGNIKSFLEINLHLRKIGFDIFTNRIYRYRTRRSSNPLPRPKWVWRMRFLNTWDTQSSSSVRRSTAPPGRCPPSEILNTFRH